MKSASLSRIAPLTVSALLALLAGHTVFSVQVQHTAEGEALLQALVSAAAIAVLCISFLPAIRQAYRTRTRSSFAVVCLLGMTLAAVLGPAGFLGGPPDAPMPRQLAVLSVAFMAAGGFIIPFFIANLGGVAFLLPHGQKVLPVLATILVIVAPAAYVAEMDINSPSSAMLLVYAILWAHTWWHPPFMPRRKTHIEPAGAAVQQQ
jgi:hypothetical protein